MPAVYFSPDDMCTTLKLEMKRVQDFFLANGWTVAAEPGRADLALNLTCAGWDKLEQASLDRLRDLAATGVPVVNLGCVNDYHPEAVARIFDGPCLGTRSLAGLERLEQLVGHVATPLAAIPEPSTFRTPEDYRLYDLTKRFVNICLGCSFACSYCPHRIGLGPLTSRPLEDVLDQIRELQKGDLRIAVLTGMETALWGRDLGRTYPELLRAVLDLPGDFDVHVAQFHPAGLTRYGGELEELLAHPRVTDIQIPIQTTSKRLLGLMNRPPDVDRALEALARVKQANPRAVLRTDLIVGFPTETLEELAASVDAACRVFDEVAAYGCELRPGLPAHRLQDQALSPADLAARIQWAVERIESRGVMAHGGQQSDVPLTEIEQRKQALRRAKGLC